MNSSSPSILSSLNRRDGGDARASLSRATVEASKNVFSTSRRGTARRGTSRVGRSSIGRAFGFFFVPTPSRMEVVPDERAVDRL